MPKNNKNLTIASNYTKGIVGLYLFIFGIILQYILFLDNKIRYGDLPDADFTPFLYGALVGLIMILIELYGFILLIYSLARKYPKDIWLPPMLNFLGFIIFIGSIMIESFGLPFFGYYILKLISLVLAIRLIISIKKR